MARRRSRRRKSSYREEPESTGVPVELVVEDLSPRARRLAESGVIDLDAIVGSGEGGRITSGDILHAARVMEMEHSVARIETVGRVTGDSDTQETAAESDPVAEAEPEPPTQTETVPADDPVPHAIDTGEQAVPEAAAADTAEDSDPVADPTHSEATTSSSPNVGGEVIGVPPNPWDAYNGSSEGLSESALPGAEQSWGEAEANIAAIAEEAAAQIFRRSESAATPAPETPAGSDEAAVVAESTPEAGEQPPEPEASEPGVEPEVPVPTNAVVAALSDIEAAVDPDPVGVEPDETDTVAVPDTQMTETEPQPEPREAMMDFGTLELVDPESVWAEGAEDFAPWFLAHSKQLGDVLGLEAGLSEARQFTTKSATGVLGRDDGGEEVVVVSSQSAVADDSDLGRALGMAASSGAATVALVSARFDEDQLKALSWLNNQTKSGVRWYGIEMKVVRIAESPAAMLFDLVASPPTA